MQPPKQPLLIFPNGSSKKVSGIIQLIDLEKGIMKLECGGSSRTFLIVGTGSVIFYEKGSREVRVGGLSELTVGSKVIINFDYHKMSAMYCVED